MQKQPLLVFYFDERAKHDEYIAHDGAKISIDQFCLSLSISEETC